MDYLSPEPESHEIEVKDGNRIGRRLRRGLSRIGRTASRLGSPGLIGEPFDPNAYDGDGDGFIQDGTQWQRPVVLRSQSIPKLNAPNAPEVGTDENETPTEKTQRETRTVINAASGAGKKLASRTGGLRATTDITDAEWRSTATPRELAESIVPSTIAETDELAERINVPRDKYDDESEYQTALKLHRDVVRMHRELELKQTAALVGAYEQKHGVGSYERDLRTNISQWDENLKEMFGNSNKWSNWLGANREPGTIRAQLAFFHAYYQRPDADPTIKNLINEASQMIAQTRTIQHGAFFDLDESSRVVHIDISPVEYVLARLFLDHDIDPMAPLGAELLRGASNEGLGSFYIDSAFHFLESYDDFVASPLLAGSRAFSAEQIRQRLDFAVATDSRRGLYNAIFAGRLMDNFFVKNTLDYLPSEDPRDIEMLRAVVRRSLENNPEYLHAVRKFGHAPIYVPHRQYHFVDTPPEFRDRLITADHSDLSPKEQRDKLISGKHYQLEYEKAIATQSVYHGELSFGAAGLLGAYAALGGTYRPDTNTIMLTPMQLMVAILAPSESDEGILRISNTNSITNTLGEPAILVHEYAHYIDFTIRNTISGAMWERTKRRIQAYIDQTTADGTANPEDTKKFIESEIQNLRQESLLMPGLSKEKSNGSRRMDLGADRQNRQRKALERVGVATNLPRYTPGEVPTGTEFVDVRGLSDDELDNLISDLEGQLSEIHDQTDLLDRRQRIQRVSRSGDDATKVGEDSKTSPEPYVVTPYGNTNAVERFAESGAAILTRVGQRHPILVNNAAVKLWARILGVNTEAQDVVSMQRRKRDRNGKYTDRMEDISDRILSDIKIVAPNVERQPDGHRPGISSSTSSEQFRFDPDERSMFRSRSNIGLNTDERLYAATEPISTMDFASRPRVYSIGDHHFYDYEVPYATSMSFRMRRRLGELAGRRFLNRNRPHQGDLIRAISATQFGFFIDDMPTYDTTTSGQLRILRGFVTGKIAKLDLAERSVIEDALRDATRIHSAVQAAELTKRDLYRSVPMDTDTVLDSVSIGDSIPMPITAFSPDRPSSTDKSVVMRIEKGAKAIGAGDQMITQGNFEVVGLDADGAQLVVTLRHKETFDPRHDALRPVDKFAHKPNAMRKMGGWMPRYTPEEQQKMEVDLQRRNDRNEAFGLRSMTSRSGLDLTDDEIEEYISTEAEAAKTERADRARGTVVEAAKSYLRDYVADSVSKRLSKAREEIVRKYGADKPWKRDSDAIRKWRAVDRDTTIRANKTLKALILGTLDQQKGFTGPVAPFYDTENDRLFYPNEAPGVKGLFREWVNDPEGFDLSSSQIRHFLNTGELVYWRRGSEKKPTEKIVLSLPLITDKSIIDGTKVDTGEGLSPESIKELREVLEVNLAALEAIERAYLMDGSTERVAPGDRGVFDESGIGGRIMLDKTEWTVVPNGKGVYASFDDHRGGRVHVDANFGVGRKAHPGTTGFTREIYVDKDGNINVIHDRFWMGSRDASRKSSGVGTLFNQHAFQWWKQHDGTEVWIPNPASDGNLVWPRMGFSTPAQSGQIGNQRKIAKDAQERFTNFVRSIVLRGSGRDTSWIGAQGMYDDDRDYGLSQNPEMMRRVVGWLAIAREAEINGTVDTDLITLLANIIEPRALNEEQRANWTSLFEKSNAMGGMSLFLDEDNRDNDYLPPFVIPEPTEGMDATEVAKQIERAELLRRDLEASTTPSDIERNIFIPDDGPDEPGSGLMGERQAGRLYAAVTPMLDELPGDHNTSAFIFARERSGASAPPRLLTRVEMEERIRSGRVPLYGYVDVQDISTDPDLVEQTVHNALVGVSDPSEMMAFTDAPFTHIDNFYDSSNPLSDPATTRSGMLGFLAPWARVFKDNRRTIRTHESLREAIWHLKARPEQIDKLSRLMWIQNGSVKTRRQMDYDGLMKLLIDLYGKEYESSVMGEKITLVRPVEDGFGTTDTEVDKSVKRLVSAVFSIENNRRMELNEGTRRTSSMLGKTQDLRDGLLALMTYENSDALYALLGYDAYITTDGELRIINNGAMEIMDEPTSFVEAVRMVDAPNYRMLPDKAPTRRNSSLNWKMNRIFDRLTNNREWFLEDEPRLFANEKIVNVSKNGIRSATYIRQVRQDHNINLETRIRRTRGLSSSTQKRKLREREQRREAQATGWAEGDDRGFRQYVVDLESRFNGLMAQLEQWDKENVDGPDDISAVDWDKRDEIREQLEEIADEFASLINTSNLVVETALEHEAAINALNAIINEREVDLVDGKTKIRDLPDDMLAKLTILRDQLLTEQNAKPHLLSMSRARARHKALQNAMDNFDLQFEVRWFDDEQVDLELNDVKKDDIAQRTEALVEHLYRGLFDEDYEEWSRRYSVIRDGRFVILGPDDEIEQRIRDLFADVTPEQRRERAQAQADFLNQQYNAEYEEDIIDANPVGGATRPRNVPAPTWRKVRAAMSRARSTQFEGEKEAAKQAAMRLLAPHRPDLANEVFIGGIRSRTSISTPSSRINISSKETRGSSPDQPRVPVANHPLAAIVDRVRAQGFDIEEVDLLPTGRIGSKIRGFFGDDMGWSIDDPETMAVFEAGVAEARKSIRTIPIEGHVVKKILGPVDQEIVDLFGDEIDIAMLVNFGAPTYDQLTDVVAAHYIEMDRLNKIFGSYEVDGRIIGGGRGRKKGNRGEVGPGNSAYLTTMYAHGDETRKAFIFRDIRNNEVARISNKKEERVAELLDEVEDGMPATTLAGLLERGERTIKEVNTNDVIFGVMAEAVGLMEKHPDLAYSNGNLGVLRKQLDALTELYGLIEFAPTPAGKHLQGLFEGRLAKLSKNLELIENIGKRYVHLARERDISDDDIAGMLATLLRESLNKRGSRGERMLKTGRGFVAFTNGQPTSQSSTQPAAQQALEGFVRQKLASALVPKIVDGDVEKIGFHEIGHFALGQAFTRHGEFVANAWTWLLYGDAHWGTFTEAQRQQSELFDGFTIRENFGRVLSPEQRLALKTHKHGNNVASFAGTWGDFQRNGKHVNLTNKDAQQMLRDVIDKVSSRTDLTDEQKLEITKELTRSFESGDFVLRPADSKKAPDFVVEAAREIGLDDAIIGDGGWNIRTDTVYDKFVPLPSHLFGWLRREGSQSAPPTTGLSSSSSPVGRATEAFRDTLKKARDEKEMLRLAKDGTNMNRIATQLGYHPTQVKRILTRLMREGKLDKLPVGTMGAAATQRNRHRDTILRLAKQGLSATQIANEIGGIPRQTVTRIMEGLVKDGELEKITIGQKGNRIGPERTSAILKLAKEGYTITEIMKQLGEKWETTRRTLDKLADEGKLERVSRTGADGRTVEVFIDPELSGKATPRLRRDFAHLVRSLDTLMGQRPALLGDETAEEMAIIERNYQQSRQLARRRLSAIMDIIQQTAKKYPELAKDFASELEKLKQ